MGAHAVQPQQQISRLIQTRQWREGLECSGRALALEPGNAALLLQRSQCLIGLGRLSDGAQAALAALRFAASDAALLDAIGTALSRCNEHAQAISAYDRALALEPQRPGYLFNRAAVRRYLGALAAAEADYDRVIALDPSDYEAYKNRTDLRSQSADRNHVAELEALLARGGLPWQGEVQLRYALAKEYEDLGQYARSFAQLQRGARRRREHLRYDVATDVATADWIMQAFTQGAAGAAPDAAQPADAAPIFIVGLPRSGSTLVERILSSHTKVQAAGELNSFALSLVEAVQRRTGRRQLPRPELIAESAALDFAALGRDYLERARAAGAGAGRFTDKMPLNYLYCGLIARALPHAKIVHMSRSPLAACYAIHKTLFKDGYPFAYDLKELARYYVAYRRLMAHWQRSMPERIHTLGYEELVADQLGQTRKLLQFCGLEWQEDCMQFHRNPAPSTTASAAQVRQPLYDSSVLQWRHYRQQLSELESLLRDAGIGVDEEDAR